jgi:predicted Zn-dependent protease
VTDQFKIAHQPEYDALNAFDAANNVEPFRTIAERIATSHDFWATHPIVDQISAAMEDAYNLGERRGPLVPRR